MDLSKFKKISSDDKMTTLQHEDGHQIKIAHAPLSKQHRKSLDELTMHYAEGTPDSTIGDESDRAPSSEPQYDEYEAEKIAEGSHIPRGDQETQQYYENAPAQNYIPSAKYPIAAPGMSNIDYPRLENAPIPGSTFTPMTSEDGTETGGTSTVPQTTLQSPTEQVNQMVPQPGELPAHAALRNAQQNLQQGIAATQASAGVQKMGAETAAAQDQAAVMAAKDAWNNSQQNLKELREAMSTDIGSYRNAHVQTPQEIMWGNKSTGQKIATGLGLFIAGLGGPGNLKMINDQVQQTMDAQKANMGKYPTLLEANIKKYGSVELGQQVTQTQIKERLALMMDSLKNQLTGADAFNRANATISAWKQSLLPEWQNLGNQLFMQNLINHPAIKTARPETQIGIGSAAGLISPQQVGKMQEDLTNWRSAMQARDGALSSFDHINQQVGKGTLNPNDYAATRGRFVESMLPLLRGRYSEERAQEIANSYLPQKLGMTNLGDFKKTLANKRNGIVQEFNQLKEMNPTSLKTNPFIPINLNGDEYQYDQYGNQKIQRMAPIIPKNRQPKR